MFGLLNRTLSNESHRKQSQTSLLKITRAIYVTSLKSRVGTSFRHPDKVRGGGGGEGAGGGLGWEVIRSRSQ